ncbi:MAG: glycosyltransferase family 1 protein [Pedobacter sp.]|nr:MAG: glycosyltransferase family 1 protein [Pedobacter sp.]
MEILFISHKYPPAIGGMEKQSFELIHRMESLTKIHKIVYHGGESRLVFFAKLFTRVKNMLAAHPTISIIHFNDGLMGAFGMLLNLTGLKRTVTLHGLDVVFPGLIYQKLIFPLFNKFDLIFSVSRATAIACMERGINQEKIVVVNNGVDDAVTSSKSRLEINDLLSHKYQLKVAGKRILVALGRPVKRKGFSWFIKNVMPAVHKDFILVVIGPKRPSKRVLLSILPAFFTKKMDLFLGAPSDESELQKLLKKRELNKNVIRLGKLPQCDVDAIMGVADAFVMPNIEVEGDMEGFGLVCLEACIRGVNVLASASGGITDAIVNGKNGVLLPPGHIVSWRRAINSIVDYPDQQLNAEDIVSFTAKEFGWDKMAKKYFEYFLAIK